MYAGREALYFENCEGLRLVLLNNNGDEVPEYWQQPWTDSIVLEEH